MAESSLTFPDIEQLRAFIDYAETPALLMLVGHLTDDVAVLRDEWRPDPDLLPQGNLDRETEAEVRRYCLARLEAFADSGAPLPSRPSASMLQAIGDWGLGGLGDEVTALLDQALVPDLEDRRAPDWTAESLDPDREFRVAIIGAGISGLLAGLRMKQANVPSSSSRRATKSAEPGTRTRIPTAGRTCTVTSTHTLSSLTIGRRTSAGRG